VALPQSPEWRRPDRNAAAARAARDRVLDRAVAAGAVPNDEVVRAKYESVPTARKQLPMLAAHAADQVVAAEPDRRVHRLTIDAGLQKTLQDLARERARSAPIFRGDPPSTMPAARCGRALPPPTISMPAAPARWT
jgi:penicillin-binding protein 1C